MDIQNGLSWNEEDASKKYEVSEFKKFKYDNIDNKIFDLIDRIHSKSKDIEDDVEDVVRSINKLSNKYEDCTYYDDYINDMINVLVLRTIDLTNVNKLALNNIISSVTELVKDDKNLIADLQFYASLLKR